MEISCPFCNCEFEAEECGVDECPNCKEIYNIEESTDGFDLNSWFSITWKNLFLED